MAPERLNPLNDFLFLKMMGEKGDEEQLLSFLNAVLMSSGKDPLQSVEIIENRAIPADIIGGKASVLDVRALTGTDDRADIEVQLRNLGNMDRRSLFYWSREFSKGLLAGEEYEEVPNVIAINIVGYEFLSQVADFHTSFHIWEDRHRDIMLTDALEIHFIDMVKFRLLGERDLEHDPLQRWLTYFDKESSREMVEEVLEMDAAIRKAEAKVRHVSGDEEALRIYEMREKALSDWTSGVNHARREGKKEGEKEGIKKVACNLKMMGEAVEKIVRVTGLSPDEIAGL
jgi:predicted transposase/invertase (TIGR01784 family)